LKHIPTLDPEERPILSQRDEEWAEEWLYFQQPADQPTSQPASQPASQPTDRLSYKIFKMEYLRNR
jgi:hypothetical protein